LFIIALYCSVFYFADLLFDCVNFLTHQANSQTIISVKSNIASLVFLFPAYLVLSYYLNKTHYSAEAELNPFFFHKFYVRVTLFFSVITALFTAIHLLKSILINDQTLNFNLKLLVLLLIISWLLIFYSAGELRKPHWSSCQLKCFAYTTSAIVILVIIFSFYMVKSLEKTLPNPILTPSTIVKKNKQLVEQNKQRAIDLLETDAAIRSYAKQKKYLPTSLNAISLAIPTFKIHLDPVSKLPYKYVIVNNSSFKLCARFVLNSSADFGMNEFSKWKQLEKHEDFCYLRKVMFDRMHGKLDN
ncbi:MAG: hypothetical protein REH83_04795, partial [Rickettsiella sp.]|nr:hypothetical protein [Rickettsiella sp.]